MEAQRGVPPPRRIVADCAHVKPFAMARHLLVMPATNVDTRGTGHPLHTAHIAVLGLVESVAGRAQPGHNPQRPCDI
jgi:hypothetical protein